jgi:hypothetical protein
MGEDSMGVNPAIVADSNGHRIYKGDATASTFSRHDNLLLYTLPIKEIENPKTEDWKPKTEVQMTTLTNEFHQVIRVMKKNTASLSMMLEVYKV